MDAATLAQANSSTRQAVARRGLSRVLAKLATGQNITVTYLGDSGLEGLTSTTPGTDDTASVVKSTLDSRFGVTTVKNNRAVGGWRAYCPMDPNQASPTKFSLALGDVADLYVIGDLPGHNDVRSGVNTLTGAKTPGSGYTLNAGIRAVEHMIRRLRIDVPGADIIISNGWPYTGTAFSQNTDLILYGNALRRLAATYGCAFVDYYTAMLNAGVTGSNATVDDPYIWPTGDPNAQHPTSLGHAVWAKAITDLLPKQNGLVSIGAAGPQALPAPIYGAERYTHTPWTWITFFAGNARSFGTSGYLLGGSWAGTGSLPQTSTTAGDYVLFQVIGHELAVRFDGSGHVKVEVDGNVLNADLDLSLIGNNWMPFDLGPGVHSVQFTVISGSVTYRAASYSPILAKRIPYTSKLITYTGTWAAAGSASTAFDGNAWKTTTLNDTATVEWVGTDLYCHGYLFGNGVTANIGVNTDGAGEAVTARGVSGASNVYTGFSVATGLPYGRHTTVIRLASSGRDFRISTMIAYDSARCDRPRSIRGLTVSGESPAFPIALPSKPIVRLAPDDATSAIPPYVSALATTGFTANGTASARHVYEAETGRIAY